MKLRARIGNWLRYKLADRIDPNGAPRHVGRSFTFEIYEGMRIREDGKGCQLWYLGERDYRRAHDEADTAHPQINWKTMTSAYVGGAKDS